MLCFNPFPDLLIIWSLFHVLWWFLWVHYMIDIHVPIIIIFFIIITITIIIIIIYHLLVWSNLYSFARFPVVIFPIQSCPVLNDFFPWQCDAFAYYVINRLLITYSVYSVAYYQFSLLYDWSLWRCFVLLLKNILFLSWILPFLVMSTLYRVQSR